MTTPTKSFLAFAVVGAFAGIIAFFGLSPFGKQIINNFGSPVGSTFNAAKLAEITIAPISVAATSTSILNTDSSDRIVDSGFVSCATSSGSVSGSTSGGVATWTWQFATTSVANTGLQGNTNYAINATLGTSTTDYSYVSSSTNPVLVVNRTWKSGTYMTFETNATTSANLSETCQAGVYYHGS